jgi:hypothetical protein
MSFSLAPSRPSPHKKKKKKFVKIKNIAFKFYKRKYFESLIYKINFLFYFIK